MPLYVHMRAKKMLKVKTMFGIMTTLVMIIMMKYSGAHSVRIYTPLIYIFLTRYPHLVGLTSCVHVPLIAKRMRKVVVVTAQPAE